MDSDASLSALDPPRPPQTQFRAPNHPPTPPQPCPNPPKSQGGRYSPSLELIPCLPPLQTCLICSTAPRLPALPACSRFIYELQLGVDARGVKPSLGKALVAEGEKRARLSGSGCLRLKVAEHNTRAVGFYDRGCGYDKVGEDEEINDNGDKVKVLFYEKDCGDPEEEEEIAEQEEQQAIQQQADHDLEADEAHEEVSKAEDEPVGNVATSLKVWLASVKFWAAISAPIPGPEGDYDLGHLKTYALRGQELGRDWALAIQLHTDNRANWQYVHDTFAHVRPPPPPPALPGLCWRRCGASPSLVPRGARP